MKIFILCKKSLGGKIKCLFAIVIVIALLFYVLPSLFQALQMEPVRDKPYDHNYREPMRVELCSMKSFIVKI